MCLRRSRGVAHCLLYDVPPEGVTVTGLPRPCACGGRQIKLFQAISRGGHLYAPIKGRRDKEGARIRTATSISMRSRFVLTWTKIARVVPAGESMKEGIKEFLGGSPHIWFGTDGKRICRWRPRTGRRQGHIEPLPPRMARRLVSSDRPIRSTRKHSRRGHPIGWPMLAFHSHRKHG